MVCLTTFGDTKRVISQSLIIFHTFYGYVQGRGVLSRGSAYLPPHLLLTPPYLHMGLSLHSQNPACYWSCYALSYIFCDQMPAPEESESNHLLPIAVKTIQYFFNAGQLKTFLVSLETILCPIWRGKRKKKKNRRWNKSGSSGTISCGRLTRSSCQLFTGSQSHIWIQCLWHLFKWLRN